MYDTRTLDYTPSQQIPRNVLDCFHERISPKLDCATVAVLPPSHLSSEPPNNKSTISSTAVQYRTYSIHFPTHSPILPFTYIQLYSSTHTLLVSKPSYLYPHRQHLCPSTSPLTCDQDARFSVLLRIPACLPLIHLACLFILSSDEGRNA